MKLICIDSLLLLYFDIINFYIEILCIDITRYIFIISPKLIGSRFRVQGLLAFGGAVGDQGSEVITD